MSSQIEIEKEIADSLGQAIIKKAQLALDKSKKIELRNNKQPLDSLEQTIIKKARLVLDEAKKIELKNNKQPVIKTTGYKMLAPKRIDVSNYKRTPVVGEGYNVKYTPNIYTNDDSALDKYQANEAIDNDASISPTEKLKLKDDLAKPEKLQAQLGLLSSKIISFDEQINISAITFFISLFSVFFLRYLFYGIKWSLNTLNEK